MVDVFGGGFNVGVNTSCNKLVYNDQVTPLVELMRYFYTHDSDSILDYILATIVDNNLSKYDKGTFNVFRSKYNQNNDRCPLDLYILICFSFNYQIRFNNQGEYNSSHGTNRSSFTRNMKNNLINFIDKLQSYDTVFYNTDFTKLPYNELTEYDFVYFDPPYYNSIGSYNDGNRGFKNWTIREEKQLYQLLSKLDENSIRWGLSNTIVNNGKKNNHLIQYLKNNNYNIIKVDSDYSNSNYHKKNRTGNREVYVTNCG